MRNIELESLNLNLFTLFFQQAFSHFIVSHTKSILLTQKDIHDLKQKLPSIDLTQAFFCFIKDFDTDLQTYFSLFQDDLLENYRQNLSHLIIENEFEEDVWNIKEYGANIDMDTIMEQFQWLPVEEIPASIQEMDMGIYDVFDLMDSLYLTKEEYQKFVSCFWQRRLYGHGTYVDQSLWNHGYTGYGYRKTMDRKLTYFYKGIPLESKFLCRACSVMIMVTIKRISCIAIMINPAKLIYVVSLPMVGNIKSRVIGNRIHPKR